MSYTAGSIMDASAVLLNDAAKTLYKYEVQIPYLKMANRDLEQQLDLGENQVNLISEYLTTVPASQKVLSLPTDFFLPIKLQERKSGETLDSAFVPMNECPNVSDLRVDPVNYLNYWDYRHNCINLIGSTEDRQVRLYYWRQIAEIVNEGSLEIIRGAENYLSFRNAALIAQYSAGNVARAAALNADAQIYGDRLLSIFIKNNQGNRVRRKPFRIGRGYGNYRVRVL